MLARASGGLRQATAVTCLLAIPPQGVCARNAHDPDDVVYASGVPVHRSESELRLRFGLARQRVAPSAGRAWARAVSIEALRDHAIELFGHTDARGTAEYHAVPSQRRAPPVMSQFVRRFALDSGRIWSRGTGEPRLLDPRNPKAPANRLVEIRNVTRSPSPVARPGREDPEGRKP